jgi:hypothetical protein
LEVVVRRRIALLTLAGCALLFTVPATTHDAHAAACKTTGRCTACSDCSRCKACSQNGQTCSVCRRR